MNETLYYKSRNGICVYDGSLPVSISAALGRAYYTDAAAGTVGDKSYISMKGEDGAYTLFTYDENTRLWHREDHTQVKWFARQGGELYFIDGENRLCSVYGTTALYEAADEPAQKEGDITWFTETGDIGMEYPDNKYVGKIQIRLTVPEGASVTVSVMEDDTDEWDDVKTFTQQKKRSENVFFAPKRCDHFRIRISGTGDVKIYSITKTLYEGSELHGGR